jgi:ornithine decarboxylase
MLEVTSDIDLKLINEKIASLITYSEENHDCNNKFEIMCSDLLSKSHFEISPFEENIEKLQKISAVENFVNQSDDIEPFFIADINVLRSQHQKWMQHLPRFTPFYAVKSNNHEFILKTLVSLGTSFDCASMEEIRTILDMGIPSEKIIFANPCKSPIHLKYAYLKGVSKMTFDNADELYKIKEYYPEAELVIRIDVDDSKSICQFGVKFGVRLGKTKPLLELALRLGLKVVGVSFHVGSGCTDPSAFGDAIKRARHVFDEGKELGFEFTLLDIGGGFPGPIAVHDGVKIQFEQIAETVNKTFDEYFGDIQDNLQLIAEPGRYFSSSAFTLVSNITSRRTIETEEEVSYMYYINDGVYGSFNCIIYDHVTITQPGSLIKKSNGQVSYRNLEERLDETYTSSIWGPTCDSMDCISKSMRLPKLSVGDWLVFENMGAYTLVAASRFNGMSIPNVYYFDSLSSSIMAMYETH